jgi:hypothetical protein
MTRLDADAAIVQTGDFQLQDEYEMLPPATNDVDASNTVLIDPEPNAEVQFVEGEKEYANIICERIELVEIATAKEAEVTEAMFTG